MRIDAGIGALIRQRSFMDDDAFAADVIDAVDSALALQLEDVVGAEEPVDDYMMEAGACAVACGGLGCACHVFVQSCVCRPAASVTTSLVNLCLASDMPEAPDRDGEAKSIQQLSIWLGACSGGNASAECDAPG
jgi:hypothetical protein